MYNDIDLPGEVWYTEGEAEEALAYKYEYTATGQVYKYTDYVNGSYGRAGRSTVYKYDTNDRLVGFIEYENNNSYQDFSSEISYNDKGLLYATNYKINHLDGDEVDCTPWRYYRFYDTSGQQIKRVSIDTYTVDGDERYYYDGYDRLTSQTNSFSVSGNTSVKFTNQIDYTYVISGYYTSSLVKTYTSTVNGGTPLTYTYTYDQNGNITKVVYSTGETIRYVYDDIGQLLREDNGLLGKTFVYTYDNGGNILSKQQYALTAASATPTNPTHTDNFIYSDSEWGDLLTSYGGHRSITYDEIGNPLIYYGEQNSYEFTWQGRQLVELKKNLIVFSFTYNDEGIRTSKSRNGVKTNYYLNGSQIVAEKTNGNVTVYLYDASGRPLGMQYHGASYAANTWDVYWYEKNLQGDVVAVYDQAGTKLISYTYDAWGNFTVSYHNDGGNTTAASNPFRYRGYYYDPDLGFYYLGSRYYNPEWGRFLNADNAEVIGATPNALTDKNLFAYCDNNPVMRADHGGAFWHIIGGAAIGGVIGGVSSIIGQAIAGQEINWAEVCISAASGALTGAITTAFPGMGAVTTGLVHGIVGAGTHAAVELANGRTPTLAGTLTTGITSGVLAGGVKAFSNVAAKSSSQIVQNIGVPFDGNRTSQVGVDPNTLRLNPNFTPNPAKYDAALRQIKSTGMYGVIDVHRNGMVINGQHRVLIARKLGIAVDIIIH